MVKDNENYQIKTLNKSKYNYSREAEVIHGNAATGEQYSLKRVIYSEVPITPEIAKHHWDEMDKEVEMLQAQHPYQVVSAISYQEVGGNQIIRFTPTTELIFPNRVPIFDERGKRIVGEENIRKEIEKRQAQWDQWEREGKLEEHVEIHHTDDGKTSRIKFRAAPKRVHPNESKSLGEKFGEFLGWGGKEEPESKKFRGQVENNQDNELVGNTEQGNSGSQLNSKLGGEENDKNFSEIGSNMDIDQFETSTSKNLRGSSTTETSFNLLSDDEIERADKSQLINLIRRIKKELEIRKELEKHSNSYFQSPNYQAETSELKSGLDKAENALNVLQTSNTTANNDDKSSNGGVIMASVGVVSALAIGGVALIKSKLGKKNK